MENAWFISEFNREGRFVTVSTRNINAIEEYISDINKLNMHAIQFNARSSEVETFDGNNNKSVDITVYFFLDSELDSFCNGFVNL